jgi:hypothetical protein
MQKVEVNKGLLTSLAITAAAALIGLVFLLGRETGRRTKLQDASASVPVSVLAPALPQQAAAIPPPVPSSEGGRPLPPPVQGLAVVHPTPTMALADFGSEAMRSSVAAYFNAIDHIQPGQMSGDPESMAQGIMGGLAKGDSSAFEGMIQQAESARAHLASILPPQPCATYHSESLASLDAGLALMRSLKAAMASQSGDVQLSPLASQADSLRKRSEELQREEQALRRLYRVPAKP